MRLGSEEVYDQRPTPEIVETRLLHRRSLANVAARLYSFNALTSLFTPYIRSWQSQVSFYTILTEV
jgi:hypothetical protein